MRVRETLLVGMLMTSKTSGIKTVASIYLPDAEGKKQMPK